LVQVTFAPTLTFRTPGWKEKPLMLAMLAAVVVAAVDAGPPQAAGPVPLHAAAMIATAATTSSEPTLLGEPSRNLLELVPTSSPFPDARLWSVVWTTAS
jgi:hypothetical protein